MNTTRILCLSAAAAILVAGCGTAKQAADTSPASHPVPTVTKTVTATPKASHHKKAHHRYPAAAPAQPAMTNGVAVVSQFYADISAGNYAGAWSLGGSNIAAQNDQSYGNWVAGYSSTTRSIDLTSYGTWSDGTVWCDISAVQLDGSVNTYYGTYQVSNGAIVSANISQV